MSLDTVVNALQTENIDAWLFCDFRGSDPIAYDVLDLPQQGNITRRWFFLVRKDGSSIKLTHAIEPRALDSLPGDTMTYSSWEDLRSTLKSMTDKLSKVAMQYSPNNEIPYVAKVDAGTIELVSSFGVEVVTSADLIQHCQAVIDRAGYESHVYAGERISRLIDETFAFVQAEISNHGETDELTAQTFLIKRFEESNLEAYWPPIVAVGPNAADPHYLPVEQQSSKIKKSDLLLIDVWGKKRAAGSIYFDITWIAVMDDKATAQQQELFGIVVDARDAAYAKVEELYSSGKVRGCDVDDAARSVIDKAGYGEYFVHRTGHSIHREAHGNGANMDNYETRDTRLLLPNTCFSIEPGIYIPGKLGLRSEINVFLHESHAEVTAREPQTEILCFPV